MDNSLNESFIKRVREDLGNSGYASEMQAVSIFLQKDWVCTGNTSYYDKDEEKTREIDLSAFLHGKFSKNSIDVFSTFYIVGEVKKSEKPWVVAKGIPEPLDDWGHFAHCTWPKGLDRSITDITGTNTLLARLGWRGYGIHESFKNPDQPSRWYSAFVSAIKAAKFLLDQESSAYRGTRSSSSISFQLVQPIVVLDGILLSTQLNENGAVEISEIDSAPMVFSYRSQHYGDVFDGESRNLECRVDLIRLSCLPDYIDSCQKRQQAMMRKIYQKLSKIRSLRTK